jgi:hypothetical protein
MSSESFSTVGLTNYNCCYEEPEIKDLQIGSCGMYQGMKYSNNL